MTPPTLLVMAAGMGSRFGGLKQVEPFGPGGETLLDYSVFDAMRAGFARVVFVIRRDFADVFRERVGDRFEGRIAVDYVFQDLSHLPGARPPPPGREKPWGTAHAVWCAAEAVREPFAAINADDFYGRDAFARLADFLARRAGEPSSYRAHLAMAGYRLAETLSAHGSVSRGVCELDRHGQLATIVERTAIERTENGGGIIRTADGAATLLAPGTLVSMNCWGFTTGVFALLERALERFLETRGADLKAECYLPEAIAAAIPAGTATVEVLPVNARWFGVTHRDDKPHVVAALSELIRAGEYPERLWA